MNAALLLYVFITTPLALVLGLWGGRFMLPFTQALLFFPAYYVLLKRKQWREACIAAVLWAVLIAAIAGWMSFHNLEYMEERTLIGAGYRQEMFEWIRTGAGRESDIRLFLPQHLIHLLLFSAVTLLTGGFLGLVMGAILMNYMSFYAGALLTKAQNPALVALLSWPPWAVIRVLAFIPIATALSAFFYSRVFGSSVDSHRIKRFLFLGGTLAVLDIVLKWLLAPVWQRWLQMLTRL